MKYYMAPMEGLTGYIYRNAYQKYFHDIDRYFTPFITNKKLDFKVKRRRIIIIRIRNNSSAKRCTLLPRRAGV